MGAFARGPIWPDSAGTATDPTETLVTSARELEIHDEADLACRVVVSGAACRAIVVEGQATTDGTTWRTVARRTILGTGIGTHQTRLRFPRTCLARVRARRYGGSAATLLVIHADARIDHGIADIDGQPLELAGHQVEGVICYDNGAGAAAALAASPAAHAPAPSGAADQLWYPTGEADRARVQMAISDVLATNVEVMIRQRMVGSTVEVELPVVNSVAAGAVSAQAGYEQLPGAIDTVITRDIYIDPGAEILVLARRVGGAAGTLALGRLRLFRASRG